MAIQEVAGISSVANAVSNVPRVGERLVMSRTETGAPFGPAQDNVLSIPESLSRYQVEAPSPYWAKEAMIPISFREKLQKTGEPTSVYSMGRTPPALPPFPFHPAVTTPLNRRGHVDIVV